MIKVIKQGTRKIVTCENCGCVFSYEDEDTQNEMRPMYNGVSKVGRTYIKCPQCKTEIETMATR